IHPIAAVLQRFACNRFRTQYLHGFGQDPLILPLSVPGAGVKLPEAVSHNIVLEQRNPVCSRSPVLCIPDQGCSIAHHETQGTEVLPELSALADEVGRQEARVKVLEGTVARLQEQLAAARKDSSTSSKPPSSDIVKPPKPAPPEGQQRRRIGGQPGHPKHERAAFPPELINGDSLDHRLDFCPGCGHDLEPMPTIMPRVIQQVDINDVPLVIQEHRGHPGWCSHCQKVYEAPLPIGIERGVLVGPTLTTVIAFLKGVCHASFSTVRKYVRDVLRVTIS